MLADGGPHDRFEESQDITDASASPFDGRFGRGSQDAERFIGLQNHVRDLLKKLISRVEELTPIIFGIIPMLDDQQDGINVHSLFLTQCLRDRFTKLNTMLFTRTWAEIIYWLLVIPHSHQFEWRLVMETIPRITMNEPSGDVIGV